MKRRRYGSMFKIETSEGPKLVREVIEMTNESKRNGMDAKERYIVKLEDRIKVLNGQLDTARYNLEKRTELLCKTSAELNDVIEERDAEIARLNNEIADVKKAWRSLKNDHEEAMAELSSKHAEIALLKKELAECPVSGKMKAIYERKYPIFRVYRSIYAVEGQIFDEYEGCDGFKVDGIGPSAILHVRRSDGMFIATYNTWSHVRLFDKGDHID